MLKLKCLQNKFTSGRIIEPKEERNLKNLIISLAAALAFSAPMAMAVDNTDKEDEFPLALAVNQVTGDVEASVGVTKKGLRFSITGGPEVTFSVEDLKAVEELVAQMNSK